MKEVTVWRVEDLCGHGYYRFLEYDLFEKYCDMNIHVPPRLEGGDLREFYDSDYTGDRFRNYIFGFTDVPQMLRWMLGIPREYVDRMVKGGQHKICQYRVREQYIFRGNFQLVFMRSEAIKTDEQPYSNILDLERKYCE